MASQGRNGKDMPTLITDTFDYNDIVGVLDLDKAFVHHQINALQPEQMEKGENQSRAAKVLEEEGFKTYKEIIDKLVKYGIHI